MSNFKLSCPLLGFASNYGIFGYTSNTTSWAGFPSAGVEGIIEALWASSSSHVRGL
jgi:hypothetical protein